jgi:hypothetical protein
VVAVGYLAPVVLEIDSLALSVFLLNVFVTAAAAYGLRGVYFALLEEGAIPAVTTGTAVGIISVLGYSPDVFFSPLAGWILDTHTGPEGYRIFCLVMVGFAAAGLLASIAFTRRTRAAMRP